jgi:3-phosphoshikimate 1-carboxyvinyltransferase
MPGVLKLHPPSQARAARVGVPGSKSITNRALVAAALAEGRSVLTGALAADDTLAMRDVLTRLGVPVVASDEGRVLSVEGCSGRLPPADGRLDGRSAGTVARFVLPLLALGTQTYVLDGSAQMRARPLGAGVDALRALGVEVAYEEAEGHLPVRVTGVRGRVRDSVAVRADVSSQHTSGLLLCAPCLADGLVVTVEGDVVSRPYLEMTTAVMAAFGADVASDGPRYRVGPGGYRPATYAIEPDASAASYFFAAAAITGGHVTVPGLGARSLQGDLAFVRVLERMGCEVAVGADSTQLRGPRRLTGVTADMRDLSDTAQTLAAVAPWAATPTRITGIGFIRHKESDRVGAVAAELRRAGIDVTEEADGLLIQPGVPRAARIRTYGDHRMAMSFALLALRTEGIEIEDPGCVEKTYPGYFADLAAATGIALGD